MPSQPKFFQFANVIPTEVAPVTGLETPGASVIDSGDNLKLKVYLHVGGNRFERAAVGAALVGGAGTVEYHFQDLETGAMLPSIAGGAISNKLSASDVAIALGTAPGPAVTPGVEFGDLAGLGLPATDDYYFSANTAPISTGDSASAATLKIPAGSQSGTWRVLTHAHGKAATFVSAFDDDLLIQVIP